MQTDQKKLTEANLTVGYVAKRSGVKVSTLHFYETKVSNYVAGEIMVISDVINLMYYAV